MLCRVSLMFVEKMTHLCEIYDSYAPFSCEHLKICPSNVTFGVSVISVCGLNLRLTGN